VDTDRLWELNNDRLMEEFRFMPDERLEEAIEAMPLDRLLWLADFEPAKEAEHRQKAREVYLKEGAPMLIGVVKGTHTRYVWDAEGNPLEVGRATVFGSWP
jgi:hypothetical protein